MQIHLRHPGTGDFKTLDTGWSWLLFLACGFLGLPLFFRGLALWGAVMLVLWCLRLAPPLAMGPGETGESLDWILTLALMALSVFVGFKGNDMTANRYFSLGYRFAKPDDGAADAGARRWDP